jgi:hypothetical protein
MITVPEGSTLTINGEPVTLNAGPNTIPVTVQDPENPACGEITKTVSVYKCDPSNFPTTFEYSINGGVTQTANFTNHEP